jgi:hypothetical protein
VRFIFSDFLSSSYIYFSHRPSGKFRFLCIIFNMETKEPQMESISLSETPQPAGLDSTTTTMANADWEKSKCIPNADKSSISKHTPLVSSHLPRWASNISQPASWIRSRKDTTRTSSHKPQIASQFSEEIWKLFTTLGLFVAIVVILRTQHGKLQPNWRHVNLSALIAILATLLRASMMAVVSEGKSQDTRPSCTV